MNKPLFDPNLPFDVVDQKPPFDPNLPYQAVNETQAIQNPHPFGQALYDMGANAVGNSPMGMVASGANTLQNGISKVMNALPMRIPDSVQHGAQSMFGASRALGVGGADYLSQGGNTPSSMANALDRGKAAYSPDFTPRNNAEVVGQAVGENAPVIAASALSPNIGGPAALMAQQAQSGYVSPVPAILPAVGKLAEYGASKVQARSVPTFLKAAKGIPPQVSKMALEDPTIMDLPGTSASIQDKSQGIINNIQDASRKVGGDFSNAYSKQGLKNPVEAIKSGVGKNSYASKPFEQLRDDYNAAKTGDLFRKQELGGGISEISDREKLSHLTDLKRSLQDKAVYPPMGQDLAPKDSAHNAAIKQMAGELDSMRGKLPGGDKLALADDAYSEMQDLKGRLYSAFKDPYTGQDYLNRILKGNTDWLTSGRNAGKVGAIQRLEQITGKQVLQPALKEMAAAYLNNPDTMGLASTKLSSIISSLVPTKAFLKPVPSFSLSPVATSAGPAQSMLKKVSAITPEKVIGNRVLDHNRAISYLDKAGGNKEKARQMAIADKWEIPKWKR